MSSMQLDVTPTFQQLNAFNSLLVAGLILLVVVILPPIFARNVRRTPLWFAFIGSWLLYCVSCLLLVGRQLGPDPPFKLCLFQAALIHAVPALATVSGVCFIVDVYCAMRISLLQSYWIPVRRTVVLLTLPTLAFLSVFILSLAIGLQDHTTVSRELNRSFCHINTGLPTLVSSVLSGWAIFIAIGVEIAAGIMLYRNGALNSLKQPQSEKLHPEKPRSEPPIARGMMIRISLFSLLTVIELIVSAIMLSHFQNSYLTSNFFLPFLPILVALMFGTQRDILMGWRFWKHDSKAPPEGAV
ncbi:hypothetical protein DFH06DRAFT_1202375 [Mycena polygramma]|nr:hypothetical protein DFH06DRAFT_1202375 [Mycena polygramma]